jgi:hypothetical protein
VEKIMHCDEVIHLQQLSVPWKRPSDPIFNFLNDPNAIPEENRDESMGNQGSAMMDQSGANGSRSDLGEQQQQMEEDTVSGPQSADGIKDKYERIKNVFRILIEEAPYLIDDKTFEKCEGQPMKTQFSFQIDGVRKALGIDQMEDV